MLCTQFHLDGAGFCGAVIEKAQSWMKLYRRRSFVISSGLRSMIGSRPHENRGVVSRIGEAKMRIGEAKIKPVSRRPSQTPGFLHYAHPPVKVRPLPLRPVLSYARIGDSSPLKSQDRRAGEIGLKSDPLRDGRTASSAGPATGNVSAARETVERLSVRPTDGALVSAIHVADRASRLLLDAVLILVFSPVIAAWWLVERRHRKNRI